MLHQLCGTRPLGRKVPSKKYTEGLCLPLPTTTSSMFPASTMARAAIITPSASPVLLVASAALVWWVLRGRGRWWRWLCWPPRHCHTLKPIRWHIRRHITDGGHRRRMWRMALVVRRRRRRRRYNKLIKIWGHRREGLGKRGYVGVLIRSIWVRWLILKHRVMVPV